MRIAVLTTQYPSVSQTFVDDQVEALTNAGHDVTVVADRPGAASGIGEGRSVVYLRSSQLGARRPWAERLDALRRLPRLSIRTLARALDVRSYGYEAASLRLFMSATALGGSTRRFDVVLAHFGPNGILASFLRDTGRVVGPIAVVFHGYDLTSYLRRRGARRAYRRLLGRIELALPVSDRWRERLLTLGATAERTVVLHMGVDTTAIPFREPDARDASSTTVRLLSVARLTEKKGIAHSVAACAHLPKDRRHRYTIVGDGPLRPGIEQLVTELGLRDTVELTGWRRPDEIRSLLHRSDAFIAPSVTAADGDEEGIPVAIMEAMASGVPVISSRHSGIPELVQHRVNGLLTDEGDAAQIAAAITELVDDPELASQLATNARATIESDFSAARQHQSLIDHLAQLARTASW